MIKILPLILACSVLSVNAYAATKPATIKLPPDVETNILKAFEKCCPNKDLLPGYYRSLSNGEVIEDPAIRNILFCVWKDTGYITDDGRLIIDKAAAVFPDKEVMKKILTDCDKNMGDIKEENVYKLYKCFQETTVYRIGLV